MKTIAVIVAALLLAMTAAAVKMIFFPTVKDVWFQTYTALSM
jgi:hypothetical protein